VHLGCFYSGSAQPERKGPNPSRPFGPRAKTGDSIPPSPAWPRQSILVAWHRLTGQGGAEEELRTKGNLWVAVGQKGAHHRGLAAVREDDAGWTMATARTGGHRRRRCRCGHTMDSSSSS
jgi:hypothetical protein